MTTTLDLSALRGLLAEQDWDATTGAQAGPTLGIPAPLNRWLQRIVLLDRAGVLTGIDDRVKGRWAEKILFLQDLDSGRFRPEAGHPEGSASEKREFPLENLTTTANCLRAVRALGVAPRSPLHFIDDAWLGAALEWPLGWNWVEPVATSETIDAVLLCLVHRVEVDGASSTPSRAVHLILDRLESLQDHRWGLWGMDSQASGPQLIQAGHRLLSFFRHVERPAQRTTKIAELCAWTLVESASSSGDLHLDATSILAQLPRSSTTVVQEGLRAVDAVITERLSSLAVLALRDQFAPEAERADPQLLDNALRDLCTAAALGALKEDDFIGIWPGQSWPGIGYYGESTDSGALTNRAIWSWIRLPELSQTHSGPTHQVGPAVTVVIPCHNLGRYLPDALISLESQTMKHFEIIVVDDGSDDGLTRHTLAKMETAGFGVLRKANGGVASARNLGIEASAGRYVCCLDPDDRLAPTFLEQAVSILDSDPKTGFVSGYFQTFDERDDLFEFSDVSLPTALAHNPFIQPAVFRKDGWSKVGGYDGTFSVPGIEDWDFWLRLLEAGYVAAVIPEIVWEYRVRAGQMSEGMFSPSTWKRLHTELLLRHRETFQRYAPEVIGALSRNWAELRSWTMDRDRAIRWWEWHARNRSQDRDGQETEGKHKLENELEWTRAQALYWKMEAERVATQASELEAWNQELRRSVEWLGSQVESWRQAADEGARVFAEQQAWIQELEARNSTRNESVLEKLRNLGR